MKKTGYYGDFSNCQYQDIEEAISKYKEIFKNEQNDLNNIEKIIDKLVSSYGYDNVEKYVLNDNDVTVSGEKYLHDINETFFKLFIYCGSETVKNYIKSLKDKND